LFVLSSHRRWLVKISSNSLVSFGAVLLLVSMPMFAHHGRAGYDMDKTITVKATITGFEWRNPHVQIHFSAPDDKGVVQQWTIEASNPYMQARSGWTKDDFKPGDVVTMSFHPAKSGSNVAYLKYAITTSGKRLTIPENSFGGTETQQ
jgi:Family of unknown function (DUF6152)